MKPIDLALILSVTVFWGVNFPIAKLGLAELPPLVLLALRFAIVAAVLLPFGRRPRGQMPAIVAISFVLGTLHFGIMFIGIDGVDASVAAVVSQLHVPFAAILAALFLKDPIRWRRILGLALAFGGVALIAGEPKSSSALGGIGLLVLGTFFWAISNVQVKKLGDVDPLGVTAWSSLFAVPQLIVLSALFERGQIEALGNATWIGWGSAVFMALFVSAYGYGVWYRLLGRYPVSLVSPFSLLVPISGILSGVLMLGETVTVWSLIGAALTVAGVAVIVVRRPKVAADPTAS